MDCAFWGGFAALMIPIGGALILAWSVRPRAEPAKTQPRPEPPATTLTDDPWVVVAEDGPMAGKYYVVFDQERVEDPTSGNVLLMRRPNKWFLEAWREYLDMDTPWRMSNPIRRSKAIVLGYKNWEEEPS